MYEQKAKERVNKKNSVLKIALFVLLLLKRFLYMTMKEKEKVNELRKQGYGYKKIAKELYNMQRRSGRVMEVSL